MAHEYMTLEEYSNVHCVPTQNIVAAIKDGKIDHVTMLTRTYKKVYLIRENTKLPREYIGYWDRFKDEEVPESGKDVPPWQS